MVKSGMGAALLVLLATATVTAQNANTDWPAIGGDAGSTKYSALKQITPANVSKLKRAWIYDTGEAGGTDEITPIVIGNVMYVATVSQHLIGAQRADGRRTLWKYVPAGGSGRMSEYRGVSYWPGDAQTPARILFTSGGKLIEVDAKTGQPAAGFGDNGVVDLRAGLNDKIPGSGYSVTSPPAIYKSLAILVP